MFRLKRNFLGSPLHISWDASKGKAPWTVLIATVNDLPVTLSIPDADGSSFGFDWNVPNYSKSMQALVSVADSSGKYTGVSSLIDFKSGSASCAGPSTALDFVWYPTDAKEDPQQCTGWGITYQTDKENSGIKGQVSFTFLPENGQPTTVSAGSTKSKGGSMKWTIPYENGTKFVVVANDEGKTGTGGIGKIYTVAKGPKSAPNSCKASGMFGNGLPPASSTTQVQAASTSSASSSTTAKGKGATVRPSTLRGTTSTEDSTSSPAGQSSGGGSKAGTAVGATFGVLACLTLIALLVWWLRRRKNQGYSEKEERIGYPISPWRYSTSPYEKPQTNSRASRWLRRSSQAAQSSFRVLNSGAPTESLHSRGDSMTTASQPTTQQASFRNLSNTNRDDFALSTIASSRDLSMSPASNGYGVHTTVPDDTLFPPPPPPPSKVEGHQVNSRAISPFDDSAAVVGPGVGSYHNLMRGDSNRYPAQFDVTRAADTPAPSNVSPSLSPAGKPQRKKPPGHGSPTDYMSPGGLGATSNVDPYKPPARMNPSHPASSSSNPAVLSEVMLPETYGGKKKSAPHLSLDDDEDEGQLPYL